MLSTALPLTLASALLALAPAGPPEDRPQPEGPTPPPRAPTSAEPSDDADEDASSKKRSPPAAAASDAPPEPDEPGPRDQPGEDGARSPVERMEDGESGTAKATSTGKEVTLTRAIELALAQRPRLKSVEHDLDAVRTRIGQAKANYYPQVDGSAQYVRASENGNTVSFHSVRGLSRVGGARRAGVEPYDSFNNFLVGVAVQQQIWDFGRTQGLVGQRKAEVMAAEHLRVQTEQRIAFEVARAYYEVLAAREGVDVSAKILETTKNILELATASETAGLNPVSETARAQANVAAAEVRMIRAEGALQRARARLSGVMGNATEDYEPVDLGEPPTTVPEDDVAIANALRDRPELSILDADREQLRGSLKATKGQQLPRIDAMLGAHSRGQVMPRPANTDSFQDFNWNIGVVVSVPIFQGLRVKKQKEEIEARLASVDDSRDEVSQAIVVEVRQAIATARAADKAAAAAAKGVEAAETALEVLATRYSGGIARLVELTDAQATYVNARLQLVDATYERYLARAALQLALGDVPSAAADGEPAVE